MMKKNAIEEKALGQNIAPLTKKDFSKELCELETIQDNKQFFNFAKAMLTKALQARLLSDNNTEASLLWTLKEKLREETLAEEAAYIYSVCDLELYTPVENNENKKNVHAGLTKLIERLGI